jgi:uncharacterized protein
MICPACRHQMMVVEYKKIELDFCPNCHGTWFDQGELELMLESVAGKKETSFIAGILDGPPAITGEQRRPCPVCGKKMTKVRTGDNNGLLLDVCRQKDGIWFDGGEVDQLVDLIEDDMHVKTDHYHVFNFMKDVFKTPVG